MSPVWRLWRRAAAECRQLRATVETATRELAVARVELRRLADQRDQARRDAELLALMARDRQVALSFLRDAHRLNQLPCGEDA